MKSTTPSIQMIERIYSKNVKNAISRNILESLTEWFGLESSRENYIKQSENLEFFAVKINDSYVGFLALKETGKDTVECSGQEK